MTHTSWRRNHQKYKSEMDKSRQGVGEWNGFYGTDYKKQDWL